MQLYGFNKIIKDYAKYPKILPLPCHMEHGWSAESHPPITDMAIDKPLMLVFSKRRVEVWKKKSSTPVAIMGSPFTHYKNIHKITQKPDAKGTIVFPSHSTLYVKNKFSRKEFCKKLKKLPKEFQPITVCLFYLDYIDPVSEIYRKMGFKVVTTGSKLNNSLSFVKNFYDILSNNKYAASNDVGSYTFYAIDMGLPFFLIGDVPLLLNSELKDMNIGKQCRIEDFSIGKKTRKLFSTGPAKTISKTQSQFVTDELGIRDCLSPAKMKSLLWKYLKKERLWIWIVVAYWLISFILFIGLGKVTLKMFNKFKSIKKLSNVKL